MCRFDMDAATGSLTCREAAATHATPRDFAIVASSPDGALLAGVANQDDNLLTTFAIRAVGSLEPCSHGPTPCESPACVLPLDYSRPHRSAAARELGASGDQRLS
mmetsp:Transcript_38625/g.95552  ORF Transcript_38625/g.95552 Transcript_38625/m.95552 type:complete len:105 (+) Transcript_38625:1019-1333(+)